MTFWIRVSLAGVIALQASFVNDVRNEPENWLPPAFVTTAFVKPGATVVDVGTSRVTDRAQVAAWFGQGSQRLADFDKKGSTVVGDVHPAVAEVAGALTPVPGGVGPLTIAMLLRNTLIAAEGRNLKNV